MSDLSDDGSRRWRGQVLAAAAVVQVGLSTICIHNYASQGGPSLQWWEANYRALQFFTLNFTANPNVHGVPLSLDILRITAPILTVTSLLNAVGRASRDERDRWLARHWRGHTVVCGPSALARVVVASLRDEGVRVVAVADGFPAETIDECRRIGARVIIATRRSRTLADAVRGAERAIVALDRDAETLQWATAIAQAPDGPVYIDAMVQHPDLVDLADDVGLGRVVVRSAAERTASGAMLIMPPIRPPRGPLRIAIVSDLGQAAELARAIWAGHVGLAEPAEIHIVGPLTEDVLQLPREGPPGLFHVHACPLHQAAFTIAGIFGGEATQAAQESTTENDTTQLADPIYVWCGSADQSISTARALRRDRPSSHVCVLSAEDDVITPFDGDGSRPAGLLSFLGITPLAASGLLVERLEESRLAAGLFADHRRYGRFPDTDGPHPFGTVADVGWRDLPPAVRARYFAVVAALPHAFEGLGLSLSTSLGSGPRTTLAPDELAALGEAIAIVLGTPWPIGRDADDLLRRQPFVDLADRLPALLALAGALLTRAHPSAVIGADAIEAMARGAHEAYVARAVSAGETTATNSSLVAWDQLPERLTESNREQARGIATKVAIAGGPMPTGGPALEAMAEIEHRRWCRAQRDRGYAFAAGPKDDAARTHPDLVPYAALAGRPGDPQSKDREAVLDITALLASAHLTIEQLLRGVSRTV